MGSETGMVLKYVLECSFLTGISTKYINCLVQPAWMASNSTCDNGGFGSLQQ